MGDNKHSGDKDRKDKKERRHVEHYDDDEDDAYDPVITCLMIILRILTSTVGLFLVNLSYLLFGAFLFWSLEHTKEKALRNTLKQERNKFIARILLLGQREEMFYFKNASRELASFESALAKFYRKRANLNIDIGNNTSQEKLKQWTPYGAVIYCYSVITTIGWGNIVTVSDLGRTGTVIYGLLGMPLLFTLSNDIGNIVSSINVYIWGTILGSIYRVQGIEPKVKVMATEGEESEKSEEESEDESDEDETEDEMDDEKQPKPEKKKNPKNKSPNRCPSYVQSLLQSGKTSDFPYSFETGLPINRNKSKISDTSCAWNSPSRSISRTYTVSSSSSKSRHFPSSSNSREYLTSIESTIDFMLDAGCSQRHRLPLPDRPHRRILNMQDAMLLSQQFSQMSKEDVALLMEYAGLECNETLDLIKAKNNMDHTMDTFDNASCVNFSIGNENQQPSDRFNSKKEFSTSKNQNVSVPVYVEQRCHEINQNLSRDVVHPHNKNVSKSVQEQDIVDWALKSDNMDTIYDNTKRNKNSENEASFFQDKTSMSDTKFPLFDYHNRSDLKARGCTLSNSIESKLEFYGPALPEQDLPKDQSRTQSVGSRGQNVQGQKIVPLTTNTAGINSHQVERENTQDKKYSRGHLRPDVNQASRTQRNGQQLIQHKKQDHASSLRQGLEIRRGKYFDHQACGDTGTDVHLSVNAPCFEKKKTHTPKDSFVLEVENSVSGKSAPIITNASTEAMKKKISEQGNRGPRIHKTRSNVNDKSADSFKGLVLSKTIDTVFNSDQMNSQFQKNDTECGVQRTNKAMKLQNFSKAIDDIESGKEVKVRQSTTPPESTKSGDGEHFDKVHGKIIEEDVKRKADGGEVLDPKTKRLADIFKEVFRWEQMELELKPDARVETVANPQATANLSSSTVDDVSYRKKPKQLDLPLTLIGRPPLLFAHTKNRSTRNPSRLSAPNEPSLPAKIDHFVSQTNAIPFSNKNCGSFSTRSENDNHFRSRYEKNMLVQERTDRSVESLKEEDGLCPSTSEDKTDKLIVLGNEKDRSFPCASTGVSTTESPNKKPCKSSGNINLQHESSVFQASGSQASLLTVSEDSGKKCPPSPSGCTIKQRDYLTRKKDSSQPQDSDGCRWWLANKQANRRHVADIHQYRKCTSKQNELRVHQIIMTGNDVHSQYDRLFTNHHASGHTEESSYDNAVERNGKHAGELGTASRIVQKGSFDTIAVSKLKSSKESSSIANTLWRFPNHGSQYTKQVDRIQVNNNANKNEENKAQPTGILKLRHQSATDVGVGQPPSSASFASTNAVVIGVGDRQSTTSASIKEKGDVALKTTQSRMSTSKSDNETVRGGGGDSEFDDDLRELSGISTEPIKKQPFPIILLYACVLVYVNLGAIYYYQYFCDAESKDYVKLSFLEVVYFIYVLLSTTGFGDILPPEAINTFTIFYGLAGMAMFNIMINATLELFLSALDYVNALAIYENEESEASDDD